MIRFPRWSFILAAAFLAACAASVPPDAGEHPRIAEGRAMMDRAEYAAAQRHFLDLLGDSAFAARPLQRAQAQKWLGNVASATRRFDEALVWYTRALAVLDGEPRSGPSSPVSLERRNIRSDIGLVYERTAAFDRADSVYAGVLAADRAAGRPLDVAVSLYNLGNVAVQRAQALATAEDSASASAHAAHLARAAALYRQSLAAHPTADARFNLGTAMALGDALDSAVLLYAEAERQYARDGYRLQQAQALGNIGILQEYRGDDARAGDALRASVDIVEALRGDLASIEVRSSFVANKYYLYEHLVDVLVRRGAVEDAFTVAERAKARSFLDLLGSKAVVGGKRRDDATYALVEEERTLQRRIAALLPLPDSAAACAAAMLRHDAVLAALRSEDPEYTSVAAVLPPAARDVRALLGDSAAMLSYWLTPDHGYGFVLRPDTTLLFRFDLEQGFDLATRVERARRRIYQEYPARKTAFLREARLVRGLSAEEARAAWRATPTDWSWQVDLAVLHNKLFASADTLLRGMRHLYLVPHGPLHALPFHALVRMRDIDRRTSVHVARPRYLVEDYTLSVLPAAGVLQFARRRQAAPSRAGLIVGDPACADPQFRDQPLPGALVEADSVHAFLPDALLLTRADADERRVVREMPGRGVLHFATHGELNRRDPLRSRLLLAVAPGDSTSGAADGDGSLTVAEIFNLDLDAALITLSACQTAEVAGQGNAAAAGDELVGLTRSFLYAGTPAVIASLWYVDDDATREWMVRFYGAWRRDGLDRAHAAQLAARSMLDAPRDPDWAFPYYWGAFIYVGDMER